MKSGNKPWPPYSRRCIKLLQKSVRVWGRSADGKRDTITLCVGCDCWAWAELQPSIRPIAILPDGKDPGNFDWRFCKLSSPVLIETAGAVQLDRVHELACEIVKQTGNRAIHLGGARYVPGGSA